MLNSNDKVITVHCLTYYYKAIGETAVEHCLNHDNETPVALHKRE